MTVARRDDGFTYVHVAELGLLTWDSLRMKWDSHRISRGMYSVLDTISFLQGHDQYPVDKIPSEKIDSLAKMRPIWAKAANAVYTIRADTTARKELLDGKFVPYIQRLHGNNSSSSLADVELESSDEFLLHGWAEEEDKGEAALGPSDDLNRMRKIVFQAIEMHVD